MASGTSQNAGSQSAGRMVAYDRFIEEQLRKTAGGVKSVDVIGGLLTMVAGGVGLLLVAALVDHWVAKGGMGVASRFLFFLVIFGAGVYYFVRHVLPSIIGRINPAYSAYTIERSTPSLKNSLLNFLMLRGDRTGVPDAVFNTIEEQAARRLTGVPVESAVDRSRILRVGYVLVALVVVFALYKIFSPKDPLTTAGRVLLPWANITAPSRVVIDRVTPGNHTAMRGEQVAIEATVRGLRGEESVVLTYTSADGQIIDQTIVLTRQGETDNYRGKLPESDSGIHAAIEYRVTAGDAATPAYHIDVIAAPTIVVESIDYDYPKYTGLSNRRAVHEGDIRAIEGTKVTIRARANQPIKAAWIDLDNDGRTDLKMRPQEDQAAASMVLVLDDDRRAAKHPRYSLRFSNAADQRNLAPVEHSIEVVPDLPPEIVILQPQEDQVELPLDGELLIEVQALDPDFALRKVELHGQVRGQREREPLQQRMLDEARSGQLVGKYLLVPAEEQLQVGDVLEFWGVAEDNRAPKPNHAETDRYRVRIIAPEHPQDPQRQQQRPEKGTDQPGAEEPQIPGDDQDPARDKSKQKPKRPGDKRPQNQPGKDPQDRDSANGNSGEDQPDESGERDPLDRGERPQDKDKQKRSDQPDDKQNKDKPSEDNSQSGEEQESQGDEGAEGQGGSKSGQGKQKQGKQGRGKQSDKSDGGESDSDSADDGEAGDEQGAGGKRGKNSAGQGSDKSGNNSEGGEPSDANDGTDNRSGEPGQKSGGRESASKDGSDDGAAFEEALKRIEQRDGNQSGEGRPTGQPGTGERDPSQQDSAGENPQPPEGQKTGKKSGQKSDSKPGEKSKSGQQPGDKSNSGEQGADPQSQGDPNSGQQGAQSQAGKKPGDKGAQSGGQQTGDRADKQPDGKQPSGQKPAGPQPGGKHSEQNPLGDKPSGDKSSAKKQPGDQEQGDAESGDEGTPENPMSGEAGAEKQPTKKPSGESGRPNDKPMADSAQPGSSTEKDPKNADKEPGSETKQPVPEGDEGQPTEDGGKQQTPPKGKSKQPNGKSGQDEGSGEQAGGDSGQGARSKQGKPKQPGEKQPPKDSEQQRPEAKGGDGQNDKGEPGAGKQGQDDTGSPDPQSDIQQNNDKQQKPSSESTSKEQTKSPAHGKRESNSDGAQGGDKSGGGEEGGGQQAPQRGTGSPGQNTAADEGNGQSTESGEGDTSDKPGDDVESKDGAGKPKQKPGGKSSAKPPGGKSGEKPTGDKSASQNPQGTSGAGKAPSPSAGDNQPSDPNQRGGQQGEGGPHSGGDVKESSDLAPREAPEPGGDAANLDYARKATDLVLESLDNQLSKNDVDQELLDRLDWTKQDLANFVNRWKQLKQEAQGKGEKATRARQELDEALRSLGLGKRRVQRAAGAASDEQGQLREGVRTAAPLEYADQVNAYKKGLSTVKGKRSSK